MIQLILRIHERQTFAEMPGSRVSRHAFGNVIAWQPQKNDRFILAVGSPDQWLSSAPLPEGTVVTDLMEAAVHQPDTAIKLWGPFLTYVYYAAFREESWMTRFRLRASFSRVPVSISIADKSMASAVEEAIRNSPYPRFRIL